MAMMTHPAAIWLRNTFRRAGLTKRLGMLTASRGYEEVVDRTLLGTLRPGDIVWDIGANIGYYSTKMAEIVGETGMVYAFEPSPINLDRLRERCAPFANVTILPVGLSSANGHFSMVQGEDDLGATSRVTNSSAAASAGTLEIELRRGDDLVGTGETLAPSVIKIDVEGHEQQVLEGLATTLKLPSLRAAIIEVHFGLLAAAGRSNAPAWIERTLRESSFALRWIDASHLFATRATPGTQ